jgi:hypothetical protein
MVHAVHATFLHTDESSAGDVRRDGIFPDDPPFSLRAVGLYGCILLGRGPVASLLNAGRSGRFVNEYAASPGSWD